MGRSTSQAAFVDLQAAKMTADHQIEAAAIRSQTELLHRELSELISANEPAVQALAFGMVGALARISAQLLTLQQSIEQTYRSRADRLRIDPLPFIPESRRTVIPAPMRRFELAADAVEFSGDGWFPAETNGKVSWRWSGRGSNGSLLLPTLGGQGLRLTIDLLMPFKIHFRSEPLPFIVNGSRADLLPIKVVRDYATFEADFDLPDDDGFSSFVLIIPTPEYVVSGRPSGKEIRPLGVGLRGLVLEKRAGQNIEARDAANARTAELPPEWVGK